MATSTKTAAFAALTAVLAAATAPADAGGYLFGEGYLVKHEDRVRDMQDVFGARAGVGTPVGMNEGMAVEFGLFYNVMKDSLRGSDNQTGAMLDLIQAFDLGAVAPFVGFGVGAVREPGRLDRDQTSFAAELIAGMRFDLDNGTALRFSLAGMNVYNDDVRPDMNDFRDYRANLGLLIPFGDKPAPTPAAAAEPEPVANNATREGRAQSRRVELKIL